MGAQGKTFRLASLIQRAIDFELTMFGRETSVHVRSEWPVRSIGRAPTGTYRLENLALDTKMHGIKTETRMDILSRFRHRSKFDNHEKTPYKRD
jgi:hypothetical protein